MCCFSRKIERVSDTNIFARSSKDAGQFLVYSMRLSAGEDLAMILPIPVPKESKEDAVRFINLEKYAEFFADLRKGFPVKKSKPSDKGSFGGKMPTPPLKVVEVGSFEASFVPAVKDFNRLDERFRLPGNVWEKLPQYKDSGFAVFKLKKGAATIHPMAFDFPRANPKQLFFPTVHIHDGLVHDKAGFDHTLYCQLGAADERQMGWQESQRPARLFMEVNKAQDLLNPKGHVLRRELRGTLKNEDVLV